MKPELIEIAREAGFTIATGMNKGQWPCVDGVDIEDELTKFAALVRNSARQAKLDELQRQEPVAYLFTDIQSGDIEVSLYEDEKPRSHWHRKSLYAAPKALEPLTQTQVVEAFCNTRHNAQYVSVFDAGVRFAEKHHGITKGTPT